MNTVYASILFNWRKIQLPDVRGKGNPIRSSFQAEQDDQVHSSVACGTSYWAQLLELRIPYGGFGAWYLHFKQAPHMILMQESCSPN